MWAGGDSCELCPRLPGKPVFCVADEPDLWRDGDTEEDNCCPLLLLNDFDYEIKAFGMLKHNITPTASGWENEDYRWNQAMETMDSVINQVQAEKLEAMKQK